MNQRMSGPSGKPQGMLAQQLQMGTTQRQPAMMMPNSGMLQGPPQPPPPQQPGPNMNLQQQQLLLQRQQMLQQSAVSINQPISVICRFGAEYVQEIVSRTLEVMGTMRALTLPQNINNYTPQQMEDKKAEMKKYLTQIKLCFDRLRQMYDKCSQIDVAMEQGEMKSIDEIMESLIPFKDGDDDSDDESPTQANEEMLAPEEASRNNGGCFYRGPKIDEERKRKNPKLGQLEQEYNDLLELNQLKSRQMKEIIDRLRKLVWDINTMLAMSSA